MPEHDLRTAERLTAVETRLTEVVTLLKESREYQQRTAGLVDAVNALDRKTMNNEMSIKAVYSRIDPIIHSMPPVVERIRTVEDAMLQFSTRFKVMATIATFISPIFTALAVHYLISGA